MSRTIGTVYILEVWDPIRHQYVELTRSGDRERMSILFHKPYNRHVTRRLRKVVTTIDLYAKGQAR